MTAADFDAIVVGSGITGGWAAKELTEKGLRVLVIERGRNIEHGVDYDKETLGPWELPYRGYGNPKEIDEHYFVQSTERRFNEWTKDHFVRDSDHPYETPPGSPFHWIRGYQLGGRSLIWGRQTYRWAPEDFEANKQDGYGIDWPIRYSDLAPWYDYVEDFIGVQGVQENFPMLPDGKFLKPFDLSIVEKHVKDRIEASFPGRILTIARSAHLTEARDGRGLCQYRGICPRGCSYGAYFSSQSSTLPAARATGRLTVKTDSLVVSLGQDAETKRISEVRVLNTRTRARESYSARIIFLCASTIDTIGLLLRSSTDEAPNGLANSSGTLGEYIMDHAGGAGASAAIPGFAEYTTFGNRPTGIIVPRFQNVGVQDKPFKRGYVFFGSSFQVSWRRGESTPGIGTSFKSDLRKNGPWVMGFGAQGECLPQKRNRVTLSKSGIDSNGIPQMRIEFTFGENERLMMLDAQREAAEMLNAAGGHVARSSGKLGTPGAAVHEMGGARMGDDPADSVVNARNQAHDIPNLFITDGSCMSSSGSVNPSLTYMAITARACSEAVRMLESGAL